MLLLNGQRATEGHDLPGLYGRVSALAGTLLPRGAIRPGRMIIPPGLWPRLTPKDVMNRLDYYGDPTNRYNTLGYTKSFFELQLVDTMVWRIRRLAVVLDAPFFDEPSAPTMRKLLENESYRPKFDLPIDKALEDASSPLRPVVLNGNYAFAPGDYEHSEASSSWSSRTSVLWTFIIEPLRSDDVETARHGYELARWFLTSTRVADLLRKQFDEEMAQARGRHPDIEDGPVP